MNSYDIKNYDEEIITIKQKYNYEYDPNLVVNYSCYCGKYFYSREKLLYILPCCHIVHEACFNKYILESQYSNFEKKNEPIKIACPNCKCEITTILNEKNIFKIKI